MSVRRSLTFMSGKRPVRSATATRKHRRLLEVAQRLDLALRIVLRSCSIRSVRSAASSARSGGADSSRSSISSSRSSGYEAN